jgi:tRNA (Thr-GGU) A37 N-methylase
MTGVLDARGNTRPNREGLQNVELAKNAGRRQIAVMHNFDLTALPLPLR